MKLGELHRKLKQLDKLERKFQFHQNAGLDLPAVPDITSARKNRLWIKWEAKNATLVNLLLTLRETEI